MKKVWIGIMGGLVGCALLTAYCLSTLSDGKLRVYFLNIGQGDAILVRTPLHANILIDGGPDDTVLSELSAVLPFYDRRIDLMILSHPHADHVNGLTEVLKGYDVRRVLVTGAAFESSVYEEFLHLALEKGVPVSFASADRDFMLGPVALDIVYPVRSFQGVSFENMNNSSIVLRVLYGATALYLSGDLEVEGEVKLAESGQNLRADVFKAGHHGSRTSSSEGVLELVGAQYGVISCGVDNQFKHPHPETLKKFHAFGMAVYRTDLDGRVEVVSDGREVRVGSQK